MFAKKTRDWVEVFCEIGRGYTNEEKARMEKEEHERFLARQNLIAANRRDMEHKMRLFYCPRCNANCKGDDCVSWQDDGHSVSCRTYNKKLNYYVDE